jgi:uncharacterized membrane protein YgcG
MLQPNPQATNKQSMNKMVEAIKGMRKFTSRGRITTAVRLGHHVGEAVFAAAKETHLTQNYDRLRAVCVLTLLGILPHGGDQRVDFSLCLGFRLATGAVVAAAATARFLLLLLLRFRVRLGSEWQCPQRSRGIGGSGGGSSGGGCGGGGGGGSMGSRP